ncbi:hypothetical protein ACJ41O_014074 [Fusarium nematophilum]
MACPDRDNDVQGGITLRNPPGSIEHTDALSTEMAEDSIKFKIPDDCRIFSPFARLPPEIRHQIWEDTLATPGMHFLKINTEYHASTGLGRWWAKEWPPLHTQADDDAEEAVDPIAFHVRRETRPLLKQHGVLRPLYPSPEADISYYTNLHQQLAKLSVTCNEAAAVAKSLTARSTTLRLSNGRIISLDCASDVIYLEYVPPDVFEDCFRFSKTLDCSGLDQIRKVAVRYCHKWYECRSPRRCPNCGLMHHTSDRINYPKHLYQFLAQYLPNLEEFFFVDYFILRKPCDDAAQPAEDSQEPKRPLCRFQGGNRTYHEVDGQDWNVQSKVFEMKSWLQDAFVKYAKSSKLSRHSNPSKVKFGVLACEWTVGPPAGPKKGCVTPVKKGRNKRAHCEEHSPWRSRRSSLQRGSAAIEDMPVDVVSGFGFVFGGAGGNGFDFTFSIPGSP